MTTTTLALDLKHMLCVLDKPASMRRFYRAPTTYVWSIFAIFIGISTAEDCSSLLGKKRYIFDDISNAFNKLPNEVKAILPGHPEVNSRCTFETLKSLYDQGYSICVGCSYTNSDHGRCHSIEVCRKGTSCIQGYNQNRIPSYYWHGCCADSDSKCRSGTTNLDITAYGRHFNLPYTKTVCKGPLCNENGYTSQKNSLISQLTGIAQTSPAVIPTTTQAPAGPVDGGFTTWSAWGACDKSCDIGVRIRTRACTNPVPSNGGANCVGQSKETELCNVNPCVTP